MLNIDRQSMIERRQALDGRERLGMEARLLAKLDDVDALRDARSVMGYYPVRGEVDVRPWLATARARGVMVALPSIQGGEIVPVLWGEGDRLEPRSYGIPEPSSLRRVEPVEVVLVPGLMFDRRGHRVGYGRGFFDRFLARHPATIRVGVAFDLQLVDDVGPRPHDAPMDWVLTPSARLHTARAKA